MRVRSRSSSVRSRSTRRRSASSIPIQRKSLDNLALLLQAQGDLARARPLYERALSINEKALGPEHPDTATSLNNLASLASGPGRPCAGAAALRARAGDPREGARPRASRNVAEPQQSRVPARGPGRPCGARPLYERALAIREKALGPEHPDTATSLNNLASLLQAQGDLVGARSLFERALAIREKALGPEHPDTASSLNNLANLLQGPGRSCGRAAAPRARAGDLRKGARPRASRYGGEPQQPRQPASAQGDLAGARPLFERALAIHEKALGPEHPDTATSLSNLAGVLRAQGDLAGARPLVERALAIREKALGPEHPDTATRASTTSPSASGPGRPCGRAAAP